MKEIQLLYIFGDESEVPFSILLENYIEANGIEDIDYSVIVGILEKEGVDFDKNRIRIFNKEQQEWEDVDEHFYLQVEELVEDENPYNSVNGIYLQLQPLSQFISSTQLDDQGQIQDQQQEQMQLLQFHQQQQQQQQQEQLQYNQQQIDPADLSLQQQQQLTNQPTGVSDSILQTYIYELIQRVDENRNGSFQIAQELINVSNFLQRFHDDYSYQLRVLTQQMISFEDQLTAAQQQQKFKKGRSTNIAISPGKVKQSQQPQQQQVNMFAGLDIDLDQQSDNEEQNFFGEMAKMETSKKVVFFGRGESMKEQDEDDDEDDHKKGQIPLLPINVSTNTANTNNSSIGIPNISQQRLKDGNNNSNNSGMNFSIETLAIPKSPSAYSKFNSNPQHSNSGAENALPSMFGSALSQNTQQQPQIGSNRLPSKLSVQPSASSILQQNANNGNSTSTLLLNPTIQLTPHSTHSRPGGGSIFGMKLSTISPNTIQPLRMSIMYSEPLVISKNNLIYSAGEPVEYEQEIMQLTRYFTQKVKNNMEITIRVANLDNLEEEIHKSSILHIACHGDFHKELQKYYLAFETKNCELDAVTTERFRILLQSKTQRPLLAFVNACHSEEVGQIFLDSGIPFVIAVQSNLKIQDKAAQIFSKSFYMELMQGNTIKQAFNSAKDSLIAKHHSSCYTCCCAHKHTDTCQWQIYALDHGYHVAHALHEGFTCDCYNPSRKNPDIKNPIYHKRKCQQIYNYFEELEYEQKLEEYMTSSSPAFYGCCCQDESTPHDESSKFKLLTKLDDYDQVLQFDKGDVEIKQNFDLYNSNFRSQFKLFGRNVEMQKVFTSLSDTEHQNQFVVMYGERGSGLTSIAKKIARHLKEREVVNEILIEDFENVDKGISKFKTKLKKYKNNSVMRETSQIVYTLMILDNCDDLILKNCEDFTKQLQDCSLRIKFLILCHFKPNLKIPESVINYVELKSLEVQDARSIIAHHLGQQMRVLELDYNFIDNFNLLMERKPILPKFVMEIVQSIKSGSKLADLLVSQDPLDILLRKLKEEPDKYSMLLVICLFPHGVSVEDLKHLGKMRKIPANWENLMLELTSKEINNGNTMNPSNGINTLPSYEQVNTLEDEPINEILVTSKSISETPSAGISSARNESADESIFKIGQYFWMSVSLNELSMIQFKIKKNIPRQLYANEEFAIDLLQKEVVILEFLSFFAKKMLSIMKTEKSSRNKMIDYSSIVDFGLFRISHALSNQHQSGSTTPISPLPQLGLERNYSDSFEDDIFKKYKKNMDALFKLQEQNLYVYLKKEDLMNLIKFMNSPLCTEKTMLKDVLKDLCLDIPSIHKILDHKEDALEQCEKAISILDELSKQSEDAQSFQLVKIKILFVQANLYFDSFDFQTRNPDEFNLLMQSLENISAFIEAASNSQESQQPQEIIMVMSCEKVLMVTYIAKILMEQKLLKYLDDSCDLSTMFRLVRLLVPNSENIYNIQEICKILIEQIQKCLNQLSKSKISGNQQQDTQGFPVLAARLSFVQSSLNSIIKWEQFDSDYIDALQQALDTFIHYQLQELKEMCLKQFSKIFTKNLGYQNLQNVSENRLNMDLKNDSGDDSSNNHTESDTECVRPKTQSVTQNIETDIYKTVKSYSKEKLQSKPLAELFLSAYQELDKRETKSYSITTQMNQ